MKLNPFAVMKEEFDGNGIVFNPDRNQVMTLNPAGVVLWQAFARGASDAEAARMLADNFDGVDEAQALRDIAKFKAELSARALLAD